jgi:hypothetical protein
MPKSFQFHRQQCIELLGVEEVVHVGMGPHVRELLHEVDDTAGRWQKIQVSDGFGRRRCVAMTEKNENV